MREIKHVVIHHAGADQPDLLKLLNSTNKSHRERKLHTKPNDFGYYIAYHYIIGVDGTIKATRPHNQYGNHAGKVDINKTSIGIMVAGNLNNHKPTERQLSSLFVVLASLTAKYGDDIKISFHKDHKKTMCPGTQFPYDLILNRKKMASKFKQIFEEEVKEPIFSTHGEKETATIADVKYLMEIGINRAMLRLYKQVESEKDKSMRARVFSFLKI